MVVWRNGAQTDAPASKSDVIAAACRLPAEILTRIERGHDPDRSEDIVFVPKESNYLGSFDVVSHSGPFDYLQRVPLVVYGPDHVEAAGRIDGTQATVADVYGTVERLVGVDLTPRPGGVLEASLLGRDAAPPPLLVFVVWDGAGRNVLDRWPDAWPNLARLERDGTSYVDATVGSSPSITPATHATLGTGAFPNRHGITGIQYRGSSGDVVKAFAGQDPTDLELETFADQIDVALDNSPKVGLLGLRIWHVPMLGHGAQTPQGDRDEVAIIGAQGVPSANRLFFSKPRALAEVDGPAAEIAALDAEDGRLDEEWMGHRIDADQDNPAWVRYQHRVMMEMLEGGGYGADAIPDLLFVNVKMTDIVGHKYSMDSTEMEQIVRAQDGSLGALVSYLEEKVPGFVLFVTADHGHTPPPEVSGGWPIGQRELEDDLDAAFDIGSGDSLTQATTAVGPFLDADVMRTHEVSEWDVAGYLQDYTVRDNWEGELPAGYEDRGDERLFDAVFPSSAMSEVMACARG